MTQANHFQGNLTITQVAKVTGLSEFTLRAWENRYGVVKPKRAGKGRSYSYEQVEHLRNLKLLVEKGFPIRRASQMSQQEISALLNPEDSESESERKHLLRLVANYEITQLKSALTKYRMRVGRTEFICEYLIPLMAEIGRLFANSEISIGQEHVLTVLVRDEIVQLPRMSTSKDLPTIAFATPEGDFHELGILMGAKLAEAKGFQIINFGPNLPLASLLDLIEATQVEILVLGATAIPQNAETLPLYLRALTRFEKKSRSAFQYWIAGAMAEGVRKEQKVVGTMYEFLELLEQIKSKK